MDTSCEWEILVNIVSSALLNGCPLCHIFVGQMIVMMIPILLMLLYSVVSKYQTTLVKSLKVSSLMLEEQKCPQSYFPSRIVDFLKYLATITTFVNISSPVKT